MTCSVAIPAKFRKLLVLATVLFAVTAVCSCRKRASTNNSNSTSSAIPSDPEEAKRQSQNLVGQGRSLYDNDEIAKASEVLKQAVANDPNNAEAHLRLGMAYAALGKDDEADEEYKKSIELLRKATQDDGKDGKAYFYLGEADSFLHQDESAVKAYRQATRLMPDDEEAWYQLGKAE